MWITTLYALLSIVGLYVFTATVFLAAARIEKSPNGKLVLDPDSWHFKVAYPFKRFKILDMVGELVEYRREGDTSGEGYAQRRLARYSPSVCVYTLNFFLILYFVWPFLAAYIVFMAALYNICAVSFGLYVVVNTGTLFNEGCLGCVTRRYPLPRVFGKRLLPIYFIMPFLYGVLWYAYPESTVQWTVGVALVVGALIAAVTAFGLIMMTISWFGSTDKVDLVREWVSAKKQGVCPLMEIKIPDA